MIVLVATNGRWERAKIDLAKFYSDAHRTTRPSLKSIQYETLCPIEYRQLSTPRTTPLTQRCQKGQRVSAINQLFLASIFFDAWNNLFMLHALMPTPKRRWCRLCRIIYCVNTVSGWLLYESIGYPIVTWRQPKRMHILFSWIRSAV